MLNSTSVPKIASRWRLFQDMNYEGSIFTTHPKDHEGWKIADLAIDSLPVLRQTIGLRM